MPLSGESIEELAAELEGFRRALAEPVLDYEVPESFVTERSRSDA